MSAAPVCPTCGMTMEWEDCGACDDGYCDAYEDDPLWYDPGDERPCTQCDGQGGWWVCGVEHEEKERQP